MGARVRCHYPLGEVGRDARIAADGLLGAKPAPGPEPALGAKPAP
jgi:hypothetical protein